MELDSISVLDFNDLMVGAVKTIDVMFRKESKPQFVSREIPKFIRANLLARQRIMFVSSRSNLEAMAAIAMGLSGNLDLSIIFTGSIVPDDWAKLSVGVQKLKDSILGKCLAVDDINLNFPAWGSDTLRELKAGHDIVVVDSRLTINSQLMNNVNSLGVPVYPRNFLAYSHFLLT